MWTYEVDLLEQLDDSWDDEMEVVIQAGAQNLKRVQDVLRGAALLASIGVEHFKHLGNELREVHCPTVIYSN